MTVGASAAASFVANIKQIVADVIAPNVPAFMQATVTTVTTSGSTLQVRIQRPGAAAEDAVNYKLLSSYVPSLGDTVLCARFGGTLVLLGRIVSAQAPPYFISAQQTGTGAQQTIAHGLGTTPRWVFAAITGGTGTTPSIVEGVHDNLNAYLTVTSGWKYRVIAFI